MSAILPRPCGWLFAPEFPLDAAAWPPSEPASLPAPLSSGFEPRPAAAGAVDSDPLTGLPERRAFVTGAGLLHGQRGTATLLALDIDHFTDFNEQHGLAAGDALLREVALRCAHVARGAGGRWLLGRVGADEFALALLPPAGQDADWLQPLLHALQAALGAPYRLPSGMVAAPSFAIGQADLRPGRAAEALLHAGAARRHAAPGDGRIQHYEDRRDERRLEQALRRAIDTDAIGLAFQPQVALDDGRLVGVEALARWTLPDGRVVPPSIFIALAERRGLVTALGERVLERALGTLARWRAAGLPLPVMAVNVSAPQFQQADAAARIAAALARHAVPAALLELELTESILLGQAQTALQTLHALRGLGVRLSIDDFGTGYSSLAYLRRFPIDRLKIDRSFVAEMAHDDSAREIVRLIVHLAQQLGLRSLAEGIETTEQLALLRTMGCDEGQGYLLGRPVTADALAGLLGAPPWAAQLAAIGAG